MAAPDVSAFTADTEGEGQIDAPPHSFLSPALAQSQCRQVPGKQHSRGRMTIPHAPFQLLKRIRRLHDGGGEPGLRLFPRGAEHGANCIGERSEPACRLSEESDFGGGRGSMPPSS
jgi:hypothetical protein